VASGLEFRYRHAFHCASQSIDYGPISIVPLLQPCYIVNRAYTDIYLD
jgi:hypothetical protein